MTTYRDRRRQLVDEQARRREHGAAKRRAEADRAARQLEAIRGEQARLKAEATARREGRA